MLIRKFLVASLLTIASLFTSAQGRINVHINNFANNKGSSIVCLYNNADEFSDKGTAVQCITVSISNKSATTSFVNIPSGEYAILVIHDANSNRKFDTNFLGIPKEGYGASKNNLPFAAAPKFKENTLQVTNGAATECHIRLRYLF